LVQITYELRARQQTTLTPRLQQSVKLLQMSTLEFSRELADAIANNPFLEEADETEAVSADIQESQQLESASGSQADMNESVALAEADMSVAVEEFNSETASSGAETLYLEPEEARAETYSGDYPAPRDGQQSDTDVGQWARHQTGLHDALHQDLCSYELSPRDRVLVEIIIEALDDDGYLRLPFSELAAPDQLSPAPNDTEWEVALRLVQQLALPGLAARNLAECLTLQLAALPESTPHRALAMRIIADCIDRLGKCDYVGVARALDCSEEEVRSACTLIRSLDPRPASRYTSIDPSCYVVPDVVVRKVGKLWVALSNQEAVPRARLHDTYAQLFRESRYEDRSLMATALQEARWLIRSLEQRNTTIQRVASAIVARQQTFFDYGEIALRPLMLSEIADELGMHESTVSRATSQKYLACPRGVYEFKRFFSRELATSTGGTCSAVAVRARIEEMIEAEDPVHPLSDVVLTQKLAAEGIVVARRTVSKYRAQLKYPPAELRRAP